MFSDEVGGHNDSVQCHLYNKEMTFDFLIQAWKNRKNIAL